MTRRLPWILVGGAIIIAVIAANWSALRFAKLEASDFTSRLGVMLFFALLIERTVEVFLTIWRAEEANKRTAEVQALIADGKSALDPILKAAQQLLLEYKAETQRWALPSSFILAVLLSSFGVRLIEPFMILPVAGASDRLGDNQLRCFHVADILFTAALLAGGADPIHKVMDTFRKFMEASASKASGTVS
jgi:hypothetical protein